MHNIDFIFTILYIFLDDFNEFAFFVGTFEKNVGYFSMPSDCFIKSNPFFPKWNFDAHTQTSIWRKKNIK